MIILLLVSQLIIIALIYINHPKFGKRPSGLRLQKILKSKNYNGKKFVNKSLTPDIAEGYNYLQVIFAFIFQKDPNSKPNSIIPSLKTDLNTIDINENVYLWFGHSSYFIQADRIKFLIDPVLSGNASPIPKMLQSFDGSDVYNYNDIPQIDYLVITHDHYDHLDYETILNLYSKINNIICPLGVGEHFEHWGFDKSKIVELDWDESYHSNLDFVITSCTSRHFSGRNIWRNNTLWSSYVLETKNKKIYLGGDSGYDNHFNEIGSKYGKFDLAIIENGQYNLMWKYIHLLPNEFNKVGSEINSTKVVSVHNSKFVMANHRWNEPLDIVYYDYVQNSPDFELIIPQIGQKVNIDTKFDTIQWWNKSNQSV